VLPAPTLPPTFDRIAAAGLVDLLEGQTPSPLTCACPYRQAGSTQDAEAATWFRQQLAPLGIKTTVETFKATIPGTGPVTLENVVGVVPGRSPQTIVVTAHRDNGVKGLVVYRDNASGTAALLELARAYTNTESQRGVMPQHTIVFVSTDGGVAGNLGASHFVKHSVAAKNTVAVVNLDTLDAGGRPRVEIGGRGPHSPSFTLLGTAAQRLNEEAGGSPGRTSAIGQLVDLAFPFSLYDHWPFLDKGVSAITLTTAGDRPSSDGNPHSGVGAERLGQVGRAAQSLIASLDQGLELSQGTSSYMYVSQRIVRGWAIALVLVALVIPFAVAVVDLFARCRRRHVQLGPAFRSYRRRLGFWLLVGALFGLFALFGAWPGGKSAPIDPESSAAGNWPPPAVLGFVLLCGVGWLLARGRLASNREATPEEELAGQTAALLALGLIALLVIATNVYALVFFLPSLHAWLWLPQVRDRHGLVRAAVFAAGLLGPALLLASFAKRFGLGLDTPWYLAELTAIGYVPVVTVILALAWFAVAAQLLVVNVGRYAPYPSTTEGAPPGFVRTSVRALVLGFRARRRRARLTRRGLA
jgi:hypothetical protein